MTNTIMQTLKKAFWHFISLSTFEDAKLVILGDETFIQDVRNGRNATIHLQKKHLPVVVRKTINRLLGNQQYLVTSMKYSFSGMDIVVSHK